ncbi:hypothetical protein Taro_056778 [Colocasia esculenta]|uniref:Uncharacterized protein n=1 Tax=Colocasia esculenta TaxID=4460 RepID=A0A843XXG3_COLES|nr:hypothetical protein [Colocasia esculenta]
MVAFGHFRSGAQIPLRERDPNSESALRGARHLLVSSAQKTSFRGRKSFVSHSKIAILADDLPYSMRLPRLRQSLVEPTRGAAQRSEVVFNWTRDLLPRSWIWVPEHRRYSHSLRFFTTPSAKELGITFRTGIRIAYVTTIRNRHSETVDKALVSRNSVPGPKFPPELATPSITQIIGGAQTRSRTVTAIGSRVQLDARSPPQRKNWA